MSFSNPEKVKALFGDLGKPTMRGIRKCPKCGTFNGTRGISCKNKSCDVIFRDVQKKKGKHSVDAVKIITGSNVQVFSVRLRDKGPDYRAFVQLPLVQDIDGNPAEAVDPEIIASASRCYVENCSKNSQLNLTGDTCPHIQAAIGCAEEAQPLSLKNSILNSLNISNETKQSIWLLATETTGPLVQRVTKNVMVVKCKPNQKHPLGFLHFAFFETKLNRNRPQPEFKFQCSCKAFKAQKEGSSKHDPQKRCVHFYACITAFGSDDKLAEEFAYYIALDRVANEDVSAERQLVSLINPPDGQDHPAVTDPTQVEVVLQEETDDFLRPPTAKKKKDDTLAQASSALLTLQESVNTTTPKKPSPAKPQAVSQKTPSVTPKKTVLNNLPVEESQVFISFHQWLASVTERINQTMHYQFDGNPDPLVFHAPQCFFDCLQQRIATGNKKKRLPNSTTAFVRRDALPLGTFTKYTWHITNVLHVKQIFDTPEMSLEITRNFVENRDGTYDLYEVPKVQVENLDEPFKQNKNQTPIRPFELKTYLKVGNMAQEQREPTPFIIEWIPDILPQSRIGELRIKFEYGHQRNGIIEYRQSVPVQHSQVIELQQIQV
ncbi:uncharacterized protein C2orf42 homolog [Lingula anatina]|uniref:Uncharacterized protein C2orf42 homolog n=1 Tax=Lingula anatina TaxID=7574 RepID=A0A1S3JGQ9_LINAN|nr:uncharacterized protein C2orf42 homolog [Lingula anatina]|eukprot:XP_013409548.1 uncharacterized protein C2orf42 homolog [Lingula anatina]